MRGSSAKPPEEREEPKDRACPCSSRQGWWVWWPIPWPIPCPPPSRPKASLWGSLWAGRGSPPSGGIPPPGQRARPSPQMKCQRNLADCAVGPPCPPNQSRPMQAPASSRAVECVEGVSWGREPLRGGRVERGVLLLLLQGGEKGWGRAGPAPCPPSVGSPTRHGCVRVCVCLAMCLLSL